MNGDGKAGVGARALARVYGVALAFALLLRVVDVWRPIDYSSHHAWRESDLGMIARNFWREDMNILHPRIDWRGDGPGLVESEFPLHAWTLAAAYRTIGYREEFGRLISLALSLASLVVFYRLARRTGDPLQALGALTVFALNPLLIRFATSVQPDPGMLLAAMLAVLFLLRWRTQRDLPNALLAGGAAGLAILLKAPALYLAPLFAAVCIETLGGRQALRTPAVWAMALLAGLPPLLWYAHAHQYWLLYGNSLGLSNESHWIGLDLLHTPRTLVRMLYYVARNEAHYVFGGIGVLLAALGLRRLRPPTYYLLYWLGAAGAFYLAAIRTTADTWAIYYHALSVPPACLLIGLGLPRWWTEPPAAGEVARTRGAPWRVLHVALAVAAIAACLPMALGRVDWRRTGLGESLELRPKYEAAQRFRSLIPETALVVTCGDNPGVDETGRPVAHDDSALLFWLDRRGFTLPRENHSVETLLALQRRGARFYVIHTDAPAAETIRARFPELARHGPYRLGAL